MSSGRGARKHTTHPHESRPLNPLTTLGGLIVLVSLAANGYFLWSAQKVEPCVSTPADKVVVMRTEGGLLEVSRINSPESFEATKEETVLGIPVGKTIARIRVPAVYRYHVELAPEWKVLVKDKTFIVIAPPVKPSLPVAIDTGKLEAESSGRWVLFTGNARVQELQRSITMTLGAKAMKPSYVEFQREAARKSLEEFVKKWLITQERWKAESGYPIHVFFADEAIKAMGAVPQPFGGVF